MYVFFSRHCLCWMQIQKSVFVTPAKSHVYIVAFKSSCCDYDMGFTSFVIIVTLNAVYPPTLHPFLSPSPPQPTPFFLGELRPLDEVVDTGCQLKVEWRFKPFSSACLGLCTWQLNLQGFQKAAFTLRECVCVCVCVVGTSGMAVSVTTCSQTAEPKMLSLSLDTL